MSADIDAGDLRVTVIDEGVVDFQDDYDLKFSGVLDKNKNKKKSRRYDGDPREEHSTMFGNDLLLYNPSSNESSSAPPTNKPTNWLACSCLPQSQKQLVNKDICDLGIINICRLPVIKLQSDFEYVWKQWINRHYPNVNSIVLQHKNLTKAIDKSIEMYHKDEDDRDNLHKNYEKKAAGLIDKMASSFSICIIRFTGWFLFKLLRALFTSVIAHKGQMGVLHRIAKRNKPIILLPTHKSHLDYIILSFLLFNFHIKLPHVAAGDNLTLPLFRFLMRSLGGFFIRRKMDDDDEQKDYLYRALLCTYMNELLKMNEIVEFYIEGGRSRSGKVLTPKTGLLSIVVAAYLQGLIDDCYIVPISLCYEKLVEGDFVHEQMGGKKEKETFTSALLAVFKCLHHSHGSVRVDVAQPFSLKEFVENYKLKLESCNGDVDDDEDNYYSDEQKALKASGDCINSSDICEQSGVNLNSYDKYNANIRSLVYDLAQHISHDQCRIHSVSSTHLLTFVLLITNKKSLKLDECVKKFSEYKDYLLELGHCMSFSGDDGEVVLHAVHLLGIHLLQFIGDINSGIISINNCTETYIELSYYANTVIMLLATQSVLAHVVYLVGRQYVMNAPADSEVIQFNKDEVLEEATLVTSLLQNEFIFFAPCSSVESSLNATFSGMLGNGFFHKKVEEFEEMEDGQLTKERCMRMATYLEGEEECAYTYKEDHFDVYQVNKMKMGQLLELKKALDPTIECYCIVAMNFINLINEDAIESEFIKNVRNDMSQRLTNRQSLYGESIRMETMNNSLKTYERLNVIRRYMAANLRFIGLVNDFTNHKVLCNFIQHIQSFLL